MSDVDSFLPARWYHGAAQNQKLTQFFLLRAIGFIYLVAFLVAALQYVPLLGEQGLLPIERFMDDAEQRLGSRDQAMAELPSLFWFASSDAVISALAWTGVLLALACTAGFANAPLLTMLWVLYTSFVNVGQIFYGYGWEMLLLEAGFLAIFLAPALRSWSLPTEVPPLPVIWLYRWLAFRLLFGAGLIKLRGDACWTDLTCLVYHYETQPNPHPFSYWIHHAPRWVHECGVLFNHFVELVVPFGLFGPRKVRHIAAALAIVFQVALILSGNLSFLNWLTIAITFSCFDDTLLRRLLTEKWRAPLTSDVSAPLSVGRRVACVALFVVVLGLSLNPVSNMLGNRQRMNASFDPLHLVNTYGAFGSVGKTRNEIIIEGTNGDPDDPNAVWLEYGFPCKPGDVTRTPCWITPYYYRFDWQIWFAAMSRVERQPWLLHFVYQLLDGNQQAKSFLAVDPFPDVAPSYVRATLYHYEFTEPDEEDYWRRVPLHSYMPPMSREDPRLVSYLQRRGLID